MTNTITSVERLCAERGIDVGELAERSGVDEERVEAIVLGRWTPSPEERDRIAGAFGLSRERVAWGHKTPVQHLYGWGPTWGFDDPVAEAIGAADPVGLG